MAELEKRDLIKPPPPAGDGVYLGLYLDEVFYHFPETRGDPNYDWILTNSNFRGQLASVAYVWMHENVPPQTDDTEEDIEDSSLILPPPIVKGGVNDGLSYVDMYRRDIKTRGTMFYDYFVIGGEFDGSLASEAYLVMDIQGRLVYENGGEVMAVATYVGIGDIVDYVPTVDTPAGAVVVVGKMVGVAKGEFYAGELGAIALTGEYDITKDVGTIFAPGDDVFYDEGTGLAVAAGAVRLGVASPQQDSDETYVRVVLIQQ